MSVVNKYLVEEIVNVVDAFVVDFLRNDEANLRKWQSKMNRRALFAKVRPYRPKRLMSKYLYFCDEERRRIIADCPDIKIRQVTCLLGERWKAFLSRLDEPTNADRWRRISDAFDADKKRYDDEKRIVRASLMSAKSGASLAAAQERRRRRRQRLLSGASEAEGAVVQQDDSYDAEFYSFCRGERAHRPRLTLAQLKCRWNETHPADRQIACCV